MTATQKVRNAAFGEGSATGTESFLPEGMFPSSLVRIVSVLPDRQAVGWTARRVGGLGPPILTQVQQGGKKINYFYLGVKRPVSDQSSIQYA